MAVNLDKPHLWKADTQASVDHYNQWFLCFAPKAFRDTRLEVTRQVEQAILDSQDLRGLSADLLRRHPGILPTLRMSCCPPLAVDRLIGLAGTDKTLVKHLEKNRLAARMPEQALQEHLGRIVRVIARMLDPDIFVWISDGRKPARAERHRASTIVADRLTGAIANPVIRNAQEQRQLREIERYLTKKGYKKKPHPPSSPLTSMIPGTFTFHHPVVTGGDAYKVKVSVDVMIQPRVLRPDKLPILVEASRTRTSDGRKRPRRSANSRQPTGTRFATSSFCAGTSTADTWGTKPRMGLTGFGSTASRILTSWGFRHDRRAGGRGDPVGRAAEARSA